MLNRRALGATNDSSLEVLNFLIDHGADLNICDNVRKILNSP